jgi:hypothetical protein
LLLVCLMGCCLFALWRFDLTVKTFVTEFVLVLLFPVVLTSDFDSMYSASAFFGSYCWFQVRIQIGSP